MTVEEYVRARVAEAPTPTAGQLAAIAILLGRSIPTPARRSS